MSVLHLPRIQRAHRLGAQRATPTTSTSTADRGRRVISTSISTAARKAVRREEIVPYKTDAGPRRRVHRLLLTGARSYASQCKWVAIRSCGTARRSRNRTRARRRPITRPSSRRWICTRTPRTTRSSPTTPATSRTSTRTSSRSARQRSIGPSRWKAATRRPSGRACSRSTSHHTCSTRRVDGCSTSTTSRGRRLVRAARRRRITRNTSRTAERNRRGACTRFVY